MLGKLFREKLILIVVLGLLSACGVQEAQEIEIIESEIMVPTMIPTLEPTEVPGIPIEGIWFSQDRTSQLIVTNQNLYFNHFSSDVEIYASVNSFDLEAETIEIRVNRILHSGKSMGYDSPIEGIKYHRNGTVLEFTGLARFTEIAEPELFILDEFLNGD